MLNIHIKKWFTGISIIGIIGLFIFVISQPDLAFAENKGEVNKKHKSNQEEQMELSHKDVTFLTEQFMDFILQDINEDYKVTHLNSKEELLSEFDQVASRDVAEVYVDFYFEETEKGLYIIPTETPAWFNSNNDYDMIQTDNKAIITQKNETDLYGIYTIEFEFTYKNSKWKITEINYL